MEWPAGWSFHQSLVLLLCGDTECPGEVAAWQVDLGGFAELRNVTQALPSRRAGYCFLFKGMNGETGIYSNKRKKPGNEFSHVLPGCLLNEMWEDVRVARRGARKVALNILNDPFVHQSAIRMDCEWCGQWSEMTLEKYKPWGGSLSLSDRPPPQPATSLSLSLSLSSVRPWGLSCQIQIPNIAHLSFTFKRNGVIAFITVRSKSEIREKANRQWLMPEAFPWFAD